MSNLRLVTCRQTCGGTPRTRLKQHVNFWTRFSLFVDKVAWFRVCEVSPGQQNLRPAGHAVPNHLLDSSAVNCALSPPKLFVSTVPLRDHVTHLLSLSTDSPLAWLSGKQRLVGRVEPARRHRRAGPN